MRRNVTIALILTLAACGGRGSNERAPDARLRVDVIGEFKMDEPPTALMGPREVITDATQQGLVDFDAAGQVVPGLATSWRVSDDGRSYIFRLREARWQDGREVTAGDVVAVYRRLLASRNPHPFEMLLANIENAPDVLAGRKPPKMLGVHDPLPNIVEIRLSAPQPEFLQVLAHASMAIMRRGNFPPSIGAFTVVDAKEQSIRLIRNETYYDASAVPLAEVKLRPTADPTEAIARFQHGAVDIVTGGTIAGLTDARNVGIPGALHIETSYGIYAYVANVAKGPLADIRVRRALSMAIDRQALVDRLFTAPAPQPTRRLTPSDPTDPSGAEPDWGSWSMDARIEEARRLLAEAGYGPEHVLIVAVALPIGREHAAIVAEVAHAWKTVGVETRVVVRRAQAHTAALKKGDYDLALVERLSPVNSAFFFLDPFTCTSKHRSYCNLEADRLLDTARATPDLTRRAQALRRAEALMIDDAPAIPLFVPVRWSLVHPRVSGWMDNIIGAHPLSRLDVLPGQKE